MALQELELMAVDHGWLNFPKMELMNIKSFLRGFIKTYSKLLSDKKPNTSFQIPVLHKQRLSRTSLVSTFLGE